LVVVPFNSSILGASIQMNPADAPTERRTAPQYAALAGMCLIWGSTFLAIRIGNETVPPLWGATMRLVIAATLNGLIARLAGARISGARGLKTAALFGFLNLGIGFSLIYWGELKVPSGIAAIFFATMPLSVAIFSPALGLHRLEPSKIVAGVIGLAGVILIFSGELKLGAPAPFLLAIFLAATIASLSTVVLKKGPPQSTFVVNSIAAGVGAPVCFLASCLLREPHAVPRSSAEWGPLLYLVLFGSLGAYVLWGWLITQWKATSVSVSSLIVPVIAVILGAAVRGESPAPTTYAGAALVLLGVTLALREPRG
jgi:drug/metabolite transporter (DMT)-like permease